jgi:hypothetical protein
MVSGCKVVRLLACINGAPTERNSAKFGIGDFLWKYVEKIPILVQQICTRFFVSQQIIFFILYMKAFGATPGHILYSE